MFRKRLRGEPLLPSRFDFGKAGIAVNAIALYYLVVAVVFIAFPSVPNPTPIDMNWSSLIFGSSVIFAMGYYCFFGRYNYRSPVEYVRK